MCCRVLFYMHVFYMVYYLLPCVLHYVLFMCHDLFVLHVLFVLLLLLLLLSLFDGAGQCKQSVHVCVCVCLLKCVSMCVCCM